MEKLLSVVIPYYTETQQEILPLLSSLNNQLGIDYQRLEVLLVNDGNDNRYPDEFLNLFHNLDITCLYMDENRGPGVARQFGLDRARGEYVMFCDADDLIHSVGVLGMFVQEIEEHQPDIITSPWLEELYDEAGEAYIYINHEDENTWMHGKAFNRAFLQYKRIRFHDELRVHEDSYFLAVAMANTTNARKLLATSYVWKWSPNTITRRNEGLYSYESIPTFLEAIGLALAKVEKTAPEQMPYKVIQLTAYQYFTTQMPHWQVPERQAYRQQAEQAFKKVIAPYFNYFEEAPLAFINEVYVAERAKHSQGFESELFNHWLSRVLDKSQSA